MTYVPPHLRKKQIENSSNVDTVWNRNQRASLDNHFYSLEEIGTIFSRSCGGLNTLTASSTHPHTPLPSPQSTSPEKSSTTTSDVVDKQEKVVTRTEDSTQDSLLCIIIHLDQHPEWKTKHKILCKSNLHVLPRSQSEGSANGEAEYPLFTQVPFIHSNSSRSSRFEFGGWWKLKETQFLAPHSKELIEYFDQKFNPQQQGTAVQNSKRFKVKKRSEEAWREGLAKEWAVITLECNSSRTDPPTAPSLRALPVSRIPGS